jgi:cyclopropane-fatty-acyl-phospholipid synthase
VQSSILTGTLFHHRLAPVDHRFTYPAYFYGFRLSELDGLHRSVHGFSHNRFNLASLQDADYLHRGPEPLLEKLEVYTRADGIRPDARRVLMFTSARYFNYVFNPVSFYFGLRENGSPEWALAEVNNTFEDRHVYWLPSLNADGKRGWVAAKAKAFHVSPFNDLQGEYRFRFELSATRAVFQVDLWKEGRPFLLATLAGDAVPLTSASLARTLLRFPFSAALTFPRIVAQAARLKFRRKLAWHTRPDPVSPDTIVSRK